MPIELASELRRFTSLFIAQAEASIDAGEHAEFSDPYTVQRVTESVLQTMQLAPEDIRATLSKVPTIDGHHFHGLTWQVALSDLQVRGRSLAHTPGHRLPEDDEDPESPIRIAITGVSYWRNRALQAINGLGKRRARARELKAVVFPQGRRVVDSKPGWISEGRAILAGIQGLKERAPAALLEIARNLERALEELENAAPLVRQPKQPKALWSREVMVLTLALEYALDELVSWASAIPNDQVLRQIHRSLAALTPSNAGNSAGQPADESATSADATVATAEIGDDGVEVSLQPAEQVRDPATAAVPPSPATEPAAPATPVAPELAADEAAEKPRA